MTRHDQQFGLILNHVVDINRRSDFETTAMGDKRPTGEVTIVAGASVYFQWLDGFQRNQLSGDFANVEYRMFTKGNVDVQPGDMISPIYGITGLTLSSVKDVRPIMDFDGLTHHIECLIEKIA